MVNEIKKSIHSLGEKVCNIGRRQHRRWTFQKRRWDFGENDTKRGIGRRYLQMKYISCQIKNAKESINRLDWAIEQTLCIVDMVKYLKYSRIKTPSPRTTKHNLSQQDGSVFKGSFNSALWSELDPSNLYDRRKYSTISHW